MSQEDTMRLVAELMDKTSGPLKDIQKSLRDTATILKKMHGEGSSSAKDHEKSQSKLHQQIAKTRHELADSFTPAMAALGITTFGVGEGLGKMIDSLKGVAEQYRVMRDATRRTGSSADFLESTANTIERLTGEDSGQAIQNLADMREQMDRLTRLRPDTLNAWRDTYNGLYESLGKKLVGKTLPQQIEETMRWMDAHKDVAVDKKRDIFKLLGLDPGLATVTLGEFHDALDKEREYQKAHPFNADVAKKLDESFAHLRETIKGVGWEMNHVFGADMMDNFSKTLKQDREDLTAIANLLAKIGKFFGMEDGGGKDTNPFADGLNKLKKMSPNPGAFDPNGGEFGDIAPGPSEPRKLSPDVQRFNDDLKAANGNYQPISFHSGDPEDMLAKGVKTGMLAAFREWYASTQGAGAVGDGGYQRANYTDGGSTAGAVRSLKAWGNSRYPNLGDGGDGQTPATLGRAAPTDGASPAADAGGAPGLDGKTGSEYLKAERARFGKEFEAHPALKERLAAIIDLENGKAGVKVGESLMNRMNLVHRSIESGMGGGSKSFYGPVRKGLVEGRIRELQRNPKLMAQRMRQIDAGLAGSNETEGYTDQGSRGDPNYYKGGTGVNENGERFNDWGVAGSRAYREDQQRHVRRDLLATADKRAEQKHTVTGDASLKIALGGFPKGTKTDLTYGGLFTKYELSRGHQMEAAEQK
jgi:hypothetical protein